jgi:hypothetical protein
VDAAAWNQRIKATQQETAKVLAEERAKAAASK